MAKFDVFEDANFTAITDILILALSLLRMHFIQKACLRSTPFTNKLLGGLSCQQFNDRFEISLYPCSEKSQGGTETTQNFIVLVQRS